MLFITVFKAGRPPLSVFSTFWWQHRQKVMEGEFAFYLLPPTLIRKFIHPAAAVFLHQH